MTDLTRAQTVVESTVTTPKNEETEVLELVNVKDEFEHEDEKPNVKKEPEEEEVKPIAMGCCWCGCPGQCQNLIKSLSSEMTKK